MFISAMRERDGENEETPKVVVCCSLVALMEDQVNRLNGVAGLRVEYKGSEERFHSVIDYKCRFAIAINGTS